MITFKRIHSDSKNIVRYEANSCNEIFIVEFDLNGNCLTDFENNEMMRSRMYKVGQKLKYDGFRSSFTYAWY